MLQKRFKLLLLLLFVQLKQLKLISYNNVIPVTLVLTFAIN